MRASDLPAQVGGDVERACEGDEVTVTLANSTNDYDWRERPATDFYSTPPKCTQALLDFLQIEKQAVIWECASGKGMMADVIEANGYKVIRSDIDSGTDFLESSDGYGQVDWIITNPPFMASEAFIRHAAELKVPAFAFLLKSQYWHAASRVSLFNQIRPAFVLPLAWRPDFLFGAKSGSPTMEVCWSVWIQPHDEPTVFQPLSRPK